MFYPEKYPPQIRNVVPFSMNEGINLNLIILSYLSSPKDEKMLL